MANNNRDWLTGKTLAEQNAMFHNIYAKIDGYKSKYLLSDEWIAEVKLWCESFMSVYSAVMQNRATEKQMNQWFKEMLEGSFSNISVSAPPVFQQITIPANAKVGLYERFRKLIRQLKLNDQYTHGDGEDLMIVAPPESARDFDEVFPELKNSLDSEGNIVSRYTRGKFGGIEEQYREYGETVWRQADKTSEKEVVFKPVVSTPNTPVRIELRAAYIVKNKRVGKWSPIYSITFG